MGFILEILFIYLNNYRRNNIQQGMFCELFYAISGDFRSNGLKGVNICEKNLYVRLYLSFNMK